MNHNLNRNAILTSAAALVLGLILGGLGWQTVVTIEAHHNGAIMDHCNQLILNDGSQKEISSCLNSVHQFGW